MDKRNIFIFCLVVLTGYLIFGMFFLDVPYVRPDEAWISARVNFFIKFHHVGDSLYPKELSPFYATIFNAVPGSQFLGLIRYFSQAVFIFLLPLHNVYALRLASFGWSLLLCLLTYKFGRKIGQEKSTALLSVACLVMIPEFFSQLHSERPEIMIATAYLFGLLLFMKSMEMEEGWKKIISLSLCCLYGWGIVIMIHGNAIALPVTFGVIYLLKEYKRFISLNTIFIGVSLLAGLYMYYYLLHAPQIYSGMNDGGGGVMESQAPPIIAKGIKSIFILPYAFFKKLAGYNMFAKPVSFFLFMTAIAAFYYLFKKGKSSAVFSRLGLIATAVLTPAVTLLLFSGSNGKFLIILFPLVAILIASAISQLSIQNPKRYTTITLGVLILLFLTNFNGISKQREYTKEYFRILGEVGKSLPDRTSTIIGTNYYYFNFKNQPYYSIGAMMSKSGKPSQSFEMGVEATGTRYLILDDFAINKLYGDRGIAWTDSMFDFLDHKCELVKEIAANGYVGFITGDPRVPDTYPEQWKYPEQKIYRLTRIRIYKVVNG